MNVFIVGGTGLLGSAAARLLIANGHTVTAIALPPLPEGASLPPGMRIELGNFMDMPDDALRAQLQGCDGLVFAAGIDERVEGPPPIYEMFRKYNITPLERLLRIARESGVRQTVVCGSYFTHFDREWPALKLAETHPYIRSRVDQERMALAFAAPSFAVAVLELPYIFGTQPGRRPVWLFLVEMVRRMKPATFYPRGGSAMVTVNQVAQCIQSALLRTEGGRAYPVGYFNLTWQEMFTVIHRHMGLPRRRFIGIPDWMFTLGTKRIKRQQIKAGHEGGLELTALARIMGRNAFIDRETVVRDLDVQPDDLDAAIGDSIRLCLDVLDGKVAALGMRGE